jgi:hypothetical protein
MQVADTYKLAVTILILWVEKFASADRLFPVSYPLNYFEAQDKT